MCSTHCSISLFNFRLKWFFSFLLWDLKIMKFDVFTLRVNLFSISHSWTWANSSFEEGKFISNEIVIYTFFLTSVIFPYNSLYTSCRTHHVFWAWGACGHSRSDPSFRALARSPRGYRISLWEIHLRWRTKQRKRFIQFIWRGLSQIGKCAHTHKAVWNIYLKSDFQNVQLLHV